jgi:glycosyltransferase involved in cell wall biosynthesis
VDAVGILCRDVLPALRRRVPAVQVRIGGRRPGADVLRQRGDGTTVVADVVSPEAFYRSVAVMAFPGTTGTGTKNSVREALAAGAPVVASRASARSLPAAAPVVVVDSPEQMVDALAGLLCDDERRRRLGIEAARWAGSLDSWGSCASAYERHLREVRGAATPART